MARWRWVLLGLVLASCAAVQRPRVYAQDSVTSACVKNPIFCPTIVGVAAEGGSAAQAIGVGITLATVVAVEVLDLVTEKKVEDVLKECADAARSDVLLRQFGGKSPTLAQCRQTVDKRGEVTLAMRLGEEMHRVAFRCVYDKLGAQIPGRFSIEQRYRYDPRARTTTVVTTEEERVLKATNRWDELTGTLVPDVVIHKGDPRYVQAIYDFKFRCLNDDTLPKWRDYESGPFQGQNQGRLYEEALGKTPRLVVPRLGVL